jgi:hypothetical protein
MTHLTGVDVAVALSAVEDLSGVEKRETNV